jgi:hypothetical protein
MAGDLAAADGEEVDLLVDDRRAGWVDAVEDSGVLSGHDGCGHHCVALTDGFLNREAQIRKGVAQPSTGCEKPFGTVLLAFGSSGSSFASSFTKSTAFIR